MIEIKKIYPIIIGGTAPYNTKHVFLFFFLNKATEELPWSPGTAWRSPATHSPTAVRSPTRPAKPWSRPPTVADARNSGKPPALQSLRSPPWTTTSAAATVIRKSDPPPPLPLLSGCVLYVSFF